MKPYYTRQSGDHSQPQNGTSGIEGTRRVTRRHDERIKTGHEIMICRVLCRQTPREPTYGIRGEEINRGEETEAQKQIVRALDIHSWVVVARTDGLDRARLYSRHGLLFMTGHDRP